MSLGEFHATRTGDAAATKASVPAATSGAQSAAVLSSSELLLPGGCTTRNDVTRGTSASTVTCTGVVARSPSTFSAHTPTRA